MKFFNFCDGLKRIAAVNQGECIVQFLNIHLQGLRHP